ncbi:MAG: DUF2812 domain-containing protein [Clostridiales bacterium]|jgi:hypothetical protein|nr:DUF2812 domain-containing protein [Clostridiales bacterium]
MRTRVFRFFAIFLRSLEKWLNAMSAKGWRLVGTNALTYEFEQCKPSEYEYRVDYVGHMPDSKRLEYKAMLGQMGYALHDKGANLNLSIGKLRVRPFSSRGGKLASSPGSFNHELLIIEKKKDSEPFEVYSDYDSWVKHLQSVRGTFLNMGIVCAAFAVLGYLQVMSASLLPISVAALAVLAIPFALITVQIERFKRLMKVSEY